MVTSYFVGVARHEAPAAIPVAQSLRVPDGLPLFSTANAWLAFRAKNATVSKVNKRMAQTPPVPVVNSASTLISFVLLTSSRSFGLIEPDENASFEISGIGVA